ncbi:hypothetical protein ANN_06773 [Periplaneta americana]|uniref:Uncharacterized protein n=1 Tax=Periplaneta americana TaxID=6978 RepID=A0ABQ8TF38_PERAM|nr:hypothetical protein ANN_06773 [Periplaneta americana]
MATVFFDSQGLLLVDIMPHGTTINSDAYVATLKKLQARLSRVRRHREKQDVLLLYDNAQLYVSHKTTDQIRKFGQTTLKHPPYSPELAPCDYHLFGKMKDPFAERGNHVITVTERFRHLTIFCVIPAPERMFLRSITLSSYDDAEYLHGKIICTSHVHLRICEMMMDSKLEQRANVKFFGKSAIVTHGMLKQAYGNEGVSQVTPSVCNNVNYCKIIETSYKKYEICLIDNFSFSGPIHPLFPYAVDLVGELSNCAVEAMKLSHTPCTPAAEAYANTEQITSFIE